MPLNTISKNMMEKIADSLKIFPSFPSTFVKAVSFAPLIMRNEMYGRQISDVNVKKSASIFHGILKYENVIFQK